MAKTNVAKAKQTQLAANSAYEDYAGSGFENQDAADYTIPFLSILQALSPQLQDDEELRQGTIINTVTGECYKGKQGICFVPATTKHQYIAWKPRNEGGGFVAAHDPSADVVRKAVANGTFGQYKDDQGNDLVETFYVYGVAVDEEGNAGEAVVSFSSSKIKKYKGWMTKAKMIQIPLADGRRIPAPLFAHRYRLTTVQEKNNKGSYYNWNIAFDGENATACRLSPDDALFARAVNIRQMLTDGTARADYESQSNSTGTDGDVF